MTTKALEAPSLISSRDLCKRAGVSYRVLGYWRAHGVVQVAASTHHSAPDRLREAAAGPGHTDMWDPLEAAITCRLADLHRLLGSPSIHLLADVAHGLRTRGQWGASGPGVSIEVEL